MVQLPTLEGHVMDNFGIVYGHLEYIVLIYLILHRGRLWVNFLVICCM
jgi:hypothetical protein